MVGYNDEIKEEVRNSNDIVDVISKYVPLKRRGRIFFGLCPFHSEKSPSFSVKAEEQFFYCFGCHAGGDVFTFISKIENLSFSYPSFGELIFDNVNLNINTDWKLGFVGRNGRGKTTFLNLLMGKYEYSGKIKSPVAFDYFPLLYFR